MPQGAKIERANTHLAIWEAFTGHNHGEVARQFNISEQSVYRIVKQQRKEVANRIQGDLFTGIAASDEEEA